VRAIATPGHAAAHHAYLVTDHVRGDEPWFVLTGDALLIGDAGRPDLHANGARGAEEMARTLYRSLTERLLTLPDHLLIYPAHYSGSVCGRGLSANPISSIGFERRHNRALAFGSEDAFVAAMLEDIPPAPEQQTAILAANRSGRPIASVR
jgi:hydroxyacylglutathione hydrolase